MRMGLRVNCALRDAWARKSRAQYAHTICPGTPFYFRSHNLGFYFEHVCKHSSCRVTCRATRNVDDFGVPMLPKNIEDWTPLKRMGCASMTWSICSVIHAAQLISIGFNWGFLLSFRSVIKSVVRHCALSKTCNRQSHFAIDEAFEWNRNVIRLRVSVRFRLACRCWA